MKSSLSLFGPSIEKTSHALLSNKQQLGRATQKFLSQKHKGSSALKHQGGAVFAPFQLIIGHHTLQQIREEGGGGGGQGSNFPSMWSGQPESQEKGGLFFWVGQRATPYRVGLMVQLEISYANIESYRWFSNIMGEPCRYVCLFCPRRKTGRLTQQWNLCQLDRSIYPFERPGKLHRVAGKNVAQDREQSSLSWAA